MTRNPTDSQVRLMEKIRDWPDQPGVYLMRDLSNRILYIGKAKNLRNRIRSYFQSQDSLSPKTRILMRKITGIEFTVTHTELEALLLECNLIKKHRPRYNVRLKDDKNFPYVVLDFSHPFPQFRITRKLVPSATLKYFGPYSTGVGELSRFLLKTFMLRDCSDAKYKNRKRPCLNYEINTCTAPCVALVREEDYAKQVQQATLFLQGKRNELVSQLKKDMSGASEKLEFEKARILRDKIQPIEKISEEQSAILPDQQKNIDVLGRFCSGNTTQWVVLFIRGGLLVGKRAEKVTSLIESEDEATQSFLEQFYSQSLIPDEIWIASDFGERAGLEALLREKAGKKTEIKLKRGEKAMRLLSMAQENARLIFLDESKDTGLGAAIQLQKVLSLPEPPQSIEGIDVSNIQGELASVAVVHFADERPLKSRYRLYYPKTVEGPNDTAMVFETVIRRFSKLDQNPPPDLLLIDGGKGQLNSALKALQQLGLSIPLCALAKSKTRRGFNRNEIEKTEERVFVPGRKNPLPLKNTDPALRLLQQVRDEAHRFSLKSHRIRRRKMALDSSVLTEVEGIGEITRNELLKKFGGIDAIRGLSVDELKDFGLSSAVAERLYGHLRGV